MAKSNHTPGPWFVHQYHETVHTSDRRICTIVVQGGSLKPQDKENAILIAAAPRMYNALKELVKWYGNRYSKTTDELMPPEDQSDEIAEAMRILNEIDNGG